MKNFFFRNLIDLVSFEKNAKNITFTYNFTGGARHFTGGVIAPPWLRHCFCPLRTPMLASSTKRVHEIACFRYRTCLLINQQAHLPFMPSTFKALVILSYALASFAAFTLCIVNELLLPNQLYTNIFTDSTPNIAFEYGSLLQLPGLEGR